ncbi:unnamed protein product [Somion occarium]|uniref:Uncharacterized protein n=2 Tax=Somion occarium TaxID=3059160 RepID=A0ABP1CHB9_9APHY
MVKPQVKGFNMQPEMSWFTPKSGHNSSDGTWSSGFNTSSTTTLKSSQPSSLKSPQSPGPSLKRSRSPTRTMELAPLPALSGDIILEVFTHRSLRFPGAPNSQEFEYGNDRLAIIGEKALEMALTDALYRQRPILKAHDIESRRQELLSHHVLEGWVAGYRLRDKLRCTPDAFATLNDPTETKHLFCSYVGGVYAQNGMSTVQNWIGTLVDPEYEGASRDTDMDQPFSFKKVKTEQFSAPPEPAFNMPQPPPPPPPMNPPPPLPNPLSPAQPQAAFLPLFNQTATQRRLVVEYPASFSGPAHAGRWTVKCVVNGMEKGMGSGPSKQLAKEEAARQAYFAMGWAPRGA